MALTEYTVKPDARTVTVYDCRKRPIELQEVQADGEDYYLKVKSPAKALKEESMNRKFRKRFEEGMKAIAASVTKKGGTKKHEAVVKRIGKLEGRYPSTARYYCITVEKDEKELLSYWIVNIIRHQLKKENERRKKADPDPEAEYPTPYWTEIVDIMSTQKTQQT